MRINGIVFSSSEYKVTQSVDYFFKSMDNIIGKIKYFFEFEDKQWLWFEKYFIVTTEGHFEQVVSSKEFFILSINNVKMKLVFLEVRGRLNMMEQYVTYIPNHYEKS